VTPGFGVGLVQEALGDRVPGQTVALDEIPVRALLVGVACGHAFQRLRRDIVWIDPRHDNLAILGAKVRIVTIVVALETHVILDIKAEIRRPQLVFVVEVEFETVALTIGKDARIDDNLRHPAVRLLAAKVPYVDAESHWSLPTARLRCN